MTNISACLVVYHEEKVIRRCLQSIRDLVDEIVVIHDGDCRDQTLEMAKQYGAHIVVEPHVGIAEPLRSLSFEAARGEWLFQIDADEYIEEKDIPQIRALTAAGGANGYIFQWELWNGKKPIHFPGLQKLCLFRKDQSSFAGIPQTSVMVNGSVARVPIILHHRPGYDNTSWSTANRKRAYWLEAHVPYFFPEVVTYRCFQTTSERWTAYTKKVRRHPAWYTVMYPIKNTLGQLKNGLWKSWIGWNIALQQCVYYFALYWRIWQKERMTRKK